MFPVVDVLFLQFQLYFSLQIFSHFLLKTFIIVTDIKMKSFFSLSTLCALALFFANTLAISEAETIPDSTFADEEFMDHTPTIAKALQADFFQIKLYWENGFYWQEERVETRWCMECQNSCKTGNYVYIKECQDNNKRQRWVLKDDKIRPHMAQNLCLFFKDRENIKLRTCKTSRDEYQKFDVFKQHVGKRFDTYEIQVKRRCLTQRHHPRSDEVLRLEPCYKPRKSRTSIWEFGGPWNGH